MPPASPQISGRNCPLLATAHASALETIDALWRDALAAPVATEAVWFHGDLHPWNILVMDDTLAATIH